MTPEEQTESGLRRTASQTRAAKAKSKRAARNPADACRPRDGEPSCGQARPAGGVRSDRARPLHAGRGERPGVAGRRRGTRRAHPPATEELKAGSGPAPTRALRLLPDRPLGLDRQRAVPSHARAGGSAASAKSSSSPRCECGRHRGRSRSHRVGRGWRRSRRRAPHTPRFAASPEDAGDQYVGARMGEPERLGKLQAKTGLAASRCEADSALHLGVRQCRLEADLHA